MFVYYFLKRRTASGACLGEDPNLALRFAFFYFLGIPPPSCAHPLAGLICRRCRRHTMLCTDHLRAAQHRTGQAALMEPANPKFVSGRLRHHRKTARDLSAFWQQHMHPFAAFEKEALVLAGIPRRADFARNGSSLQLPTANRHPPPTCTVRRAVPFLPSDGRARTQAVSLSPPLARSHVLLLLVL